MGFRRPPVAEEALPVLEMLLLLSGLVEPTVVAGGPVPLRISLCHVRLRTTTVQNWSRQYHQQRRYVHVPSSTEGCQYGEKIVPAYCQPSGSVVVLTVCQGADTYQPSLGSAGATNSISLSNFLPSSEHHLRHRQRAHKRAIQIWSDLPGSVIRK